MTMTMVQLDIREPVALEQVTRLGAGVILGIAGIELIEHHEEPLAVTVPCHHIDQVPAHRQPQRDRLTYSHVGPQHTIEYVGKTGDIFVWYPHGQPAQWM